MLTFRIFEAIPHLKHAVTTREGGISQGAYESLNLGFHVGDNPEHAVQNRHLLGEKLGYEAGKLIAAQQVHGADVREVCGQEAGRGAFGWEDALPGVDALVTREPNLPLLIQVADCAPILLAEPDSRALTVIHAGWRGAVAGIAGKTAQFAEFSCGSKPENLLAGIGPSLCSACLEVGPEVAGEVERVCPEAVLPGQAKPHVDLRLLIQRDLETAGVPTANIEIMDRCPRCETETFFSHRGQNGTAGRFGLVAWWTD